MNFDLTDEQKMLRETVTQFIQNECPATRLREIFDGDEGYDAVLWKGLVELGIAGLAIEDQYGGAGLEMLDLAVVAECIGHGALPGPFFNHALAALAIQEGGSDAQKSHWLPKLAAGDALATIALSDAGGGWQPEDWSLASGDTLTGTKPMVPFGDIADVIVVGVAGGGFALVTQGAAGLSFEEVEGADRTRRFCDVSFDSTPCEALEKGSEASARVRDAGLVLLAADAFGGAQRCLEMSVEYAKTREQFGVIIGHFQALKHQLANMAITVEPSRGLYWYAAHALDYEPEEAHRIAAVAKAHITDSYMQVARDTVEAHGGIGFTWECDVQIWFKRAMFDRAFLGAPATHRARAAEMAGW
ncbi:MAG: acyl-CoA/acyl-ACP dehydrogenase [bacterium]|nr:acyl-CoA/acyl-ACP dehydrogenase [bacterium]